LEYSDEFKVRCVARLSQNGNFPLLGLDAVTPIPDWERESCMCPRLVVPHSVISCAHVFSGIHLPISHRLDRLNDDSPRFSVVKSSLNMPQGRLNHGVVRAIIERLSSELEHTLALLFCK